MNQPTIPHRNRRTERHLRQRARRWVLTGTGIAAVFIVALLVMSSTRLILPSQGYAQDGPTSTAVVAVQESTVTLQPTATETSVPATATSVPTDVPVPPTAIPTNTPQPTATTAATATSTPQLAPTSTPLPKATATAVRSVMVQEVVNLPFVLTLSPPSPVLGGTTISGQASWSSAPAGNPTGTINYLVYGTSGCSSPLFANAGTKTINHLASGFGNVPASELVVFPTAGAYSWKAVYSGDGSYASSSVCVDLTVNKNSPSLALTVVPTNPPMRAGGTSRGSAALTGASASAGGSMSYTVYSETSCTTQVSPAQTSTKTVTNGVTPNSDALTFNQVGTFYWKATYSGDPTNNGVSSPCVALTVSKSTPTLTLVITPNPVTVDGTAAGVATLGSISNLAGGTMVYTVYTSNACTTPVSPVQTSTKTVANGISPNSDSFTFSVIGTLYWKVVYSGDANNSGVSSSCVALTVNKWSPTAVLTVSPSTIVAGETSAIASAALTNISTQASGSVTYTFYTSNTCATVLTVAGSPSVKTVLNGITPDSAGFVFATAGSGFWRVTYAGDAKNNPATSSCVTFNVVKANPSVGLTLAAVTPPMKAGGTAKGTATLTGATTAATGTVTYTVYSEITCTTVFTATGNPSTVTVTNHVPPLSAAISFSTTGNFYWKAVYSGDANNNGVTSPCVAFTVARAAPTLALTVAPIFTPMKAGGSAKGTAVLTGATNAASGALAYTVYTDSGCTAIYATAGNPSLVTVVNRIVPLSANVTLDLAATLYWNAIYDGDTNNNGAASPCVAFTVAKADPALSLAISLTTTPMRAEGSAWGKGTLTQSSTGAGGTVIYSVYTDSGCASPYSISGSPSTLIVSNKVVPKSTTITFPNTGTFYWKAVYSGDANNNGAASACAVLSVGKSDPFPWLAIYATQFPLKAGGTLYGYLYLNGVTSTAGGTATFTAYTDSNCSIPLSTPGSPNTVAVVSRVNTVSSLITIPGAGNVYLRATYSGDANNTSVTSACVTFGSNKATPVLNLIPAATSSPMTTGGTAYGKVTMTRTATTANGSLTYTVYADSNCSTILAATGNPSTVTVTDKIVPNSGLITLSTVGNVYWKVSYGGDANNVSTTSSCVSQVVAKTVPTLRLTITPASLVAGNTGTGASTLTGATTTAGGTVTYTVYTNNLCTTPINPARVSTKTVTNGAIPSSDAFTFSTIGTVFWKASYSGDGANTSVSSGCNSLAIVNPGTATLSLDLSPNPAIVDNAVVGTASLAGTMPAAGGSVIYTVFEDTSCSTPVSPSQVSTKIVTNNVVAASDPFIFSTVGTFSWNATYSGDANNTGDASPCVALTVTTTTPTVTLTLVPNPVEAGSSVAGDVTLTGTSSFAAGTVTYTVYTNNTCTTQVIPALVSTKTATNGVVPRSDSLPVSLVGTSYWRAAYGGDARNNAALSACTALSVVKASPSLALTFSPGVVKVGDNATATAALTNGTTNASGTVIYTVYTENSCRTQIAPSRQSTKSVVNGVVQPSDAVPLLLASTVYWQASYSGDTNNFAFTSSCISLEVGKATPILSLVQVPSPINIGEEFTIHMTITGAVNPTGTVTALGYLDSGCVSPISEPFVTGFVDGGIPNPPLSVFDVALNFYGQATYSGDANNAPAVSACVGATVAQGLPLTLALLPGATVPHGASVTAQATWPTADIPTGAVTFTTFAGANCTGSVLAGPEVKTITSNSVVASTAHVFPDPGLYSWQASYPGDATYNPVTVCISLTVQATPTLSLVQVPTPINIGEEFTIHMSLTGGFNPTGTVTAHAYLDSGCQNPVSEPYVTDIVNGQIPDPPVSVFAFPTVVYGLASYSGDTYNAAVESACTGAVIAQGLPLTLALSPSATILHGASASSLASWPTTESPTGTVRYTPFATTDCTGTAVNAPESKTIAANSVTASTARSFPVPGAYSWQAIYSGDSVYNPVTVCTPLIVTNFVPSVDLTVSGASAPMKASGSAFGQATLTGASSTASGQITYTVYADSDCLTPFAVTNSPSSGTVSNALAPTSQAVTFAHAGSVYWRASYSGDLSNDAVSSSCVLLTVGKASPSITLTVTPDPVVAGQNAIGAATLTNTGGSASGSMTYSVYTESTCTTLVSPLLQHTSIVANGTAPNSGPLSIMQAGVFYWQAVYGGDADNLTGTSSCHMLTVSKASPILTLVQTPDPVDLNEFFTAHMTLTNAANPTGTVTLSGFYDSLCQNPIAESVYSTELIDGGIDDPPASAYPYPGVIYGQAKYAGDNNNAAAATPCRASVIKRGLPVTLTLSPVTPILHGTSTSAHVTWPSNESPTGTFTYSVFDSADCSGTAITDPETVTISGNAVAASTAHLFPDPGLYSWRATYHGDSIYAADAVCTPLTVKATPTLTLVQVPSPINIGEAFTIHITLSSDAVAPSGSVTAHAYLDADCRSPISEPYETDLIDGAIPDPPVSTFDFPAIIYGKATYSGDANNAAATSGCVGAVIAKGLPLTVTLTPGTTILDGQSITAQAAWPSSDNPVGAITYAAFAGTDCMGTPIITPQPVTITGNAVASSFAMVFSTPGLYSWQATFPGDNSYNPATICTALTVKATPTLTLTQLPDPISIGEGFTADVVLGPDAISPTGTSSVRAFVDSDCTVVLPRFEPYTTALVGGLIPRPPMVVFDFSGVFYWFADYSGDANNAPVVSDCLPVVVNTSPLTASITSASLEPVSYAFAPQTSTGSIVVAVADERATGEGWSVTVSATDFEYTGSSSSGKTIPRANLSITAATGSIVIKGEPIGVGGPLIGPTVIGPFDQTRTLLVAAPGYGTGTYELTVEITMTVPANSQVGTYTAALTILTAAAP